MTANRLSSVGGVLVIVGMLVLLLVDALPAIPILLIAVALGLYAEKLKRDGRRT